MNNEIKLRLEWIKMYESVGKAGVVCLRCGIARPTLRKWLNRYKEHGIEGLQGSAKSLKGFVLKSLQKMSKESLIYVTIERWDIAV